MLSSRSTGDLGRGRMVGEGANWRGPNVALAPSLPTPDISGQRAGAKRRIGNVRVSLAIAILGWAFLTLCLVGLGYTLAATRVTARYLRLPRPADAPYPGSAPDVTVVKPLHGAHAHLREALESFCMQDYPGAVQIVFGVHRPDDAAIPVVRDLQASHPNLAIDLVVDDEIHGVNRKASNLVNIATQARHGVLILSDADIVVERDYLRNVTAALAGPGVGAVSCLYVGLDDGRLWSRLSAMAIDYQFLPSAVLGKAMGMANPCFGSTIAIRAEVLERIGGFLAFADHLADDYEIGRAVRKLGLAVDIPPMVVFHHSPESTSRELVSHELRWSRTVRQIDAAGHAGSVITHPLPLALIAALLFGFSPFSLVIIAVALAVRLWSKIRIDRATGTRAGSWWLIPLRDVLSFGIYLGSFVVNTVDWQGRRFRVGQGGVFHHH
jgi:ceramide glucosyltransferase